MTVNELIKHLKKLNPDASVEAFDPDLWGFSPVTGFIVSDNAIELQTDDNS